MPQFSKVYTRLCTTALSSEFVRPFCSLDVLSYRNYRQMHISPLKTNGKLFCLKTQSVPAVNTFHLGYKNQSVYDVSGTSRCFFSDKHKTNKYCVDRAYSC